MKGLYLVIIYNNTWLISIIKKYTHSHTQYTRNWAPLQTILTKPSVATIAFFIPFLFWIITSIRKSCCYYWGTWEKCSIARIILNRTTFGPIIFEILDLFVFPLALGTLMLHNLNDPSLWYPIPYKCSANINYQFFSLKVPKFLVCKILRKTLNISINLF